MYKIREGIVSRDIGKLYFLVDIHEKHCYEIKKIYSVNEMGKFLFDLMNQKEKFNEEEIFDELANNLTDYTEELKPQIQNDIKVFINDLLKVGYVVEVS